MNYEKKIALLRSKIDGYKAQIDDLKCINKDLTQENQSLKDFCSTLDCEIKKIRQANSDTMNELNDYKKKYSDLYSSLLSLKSEYRKEMDKFLKRIRKQK